MSCMFWTLHIEKSVENIKVATTAGTSFSFHSFFVYLFICLGKSMIAEVMTFVMKGWYQPGIPAVRINRQSFAIWLSRMRLIVPHKCRIKWSVCSRSSWNNGLFAFSTLVLILLLRVRWLIGLARSWSHHAPLSHCKNPTDPVGVRVMSSLSWRVSCRVLGTVRTPPVFLQLVAWVSSKHWLETWGQGFG